MSGFDLSEERWPLVVMRWPTEFSTPELVAAIADFVQLLQRDRPFALLCDLSKAAVHTEEQRQLIIDVLETHRDRLRRFVKADGIVVTSLPRRSAINSVLSRVRSPFPFRAFSNLDDAEAWCWRQLDEVRAAERMARALP